MKPGTRLKSSTCDTEVMVIRGGDATVECGGAPMASDRPDQLVPLAPGFSSGTRMGKRYVDAARSIELLCVKQGQGSLSLGGIPLLIKEAKPLPSSD